LIPQYSLRELKEQGKGARVMLAGTGILALLLSNWVALDKLLNLSELVFLSAK
jgi:hypothetical protein